MPPEPADQPGSLRYKGFPVVYQQPDLTVWAVEAGDWKVGFPLRGAGHCERESQRQHAAGGTP